MNSSEIKLKVVYLPFLLVLLGTHLFYNLFRYTFDIQLSILPLKQGILNFWIPILLPWIPILIFLRRRIRVLAVRGKRDNGHFAYQFAMACAIAVPLIISQHYIEKAAYDLVPVENANAIEVHAGEKYFEIKSYRVNKEAAVPYITSQTSGRRNQNLNFYVYVACPFEQIGNTWYGLMYTKNLSNRISDEKKNIAYRSFIDKSQLQFSEADLHTATYFEKLGNSDDRDGYLQAIKAQFPAAAETNQVILIPHNERFEDRLGNTGSWALGSFSVGALILLAMVAIPKIDKKEYQNYLDRTPPKEDDLKVFMEYLNPWGPNAVAAILILTNIAVFAVMFFSGLDIVSATPKELLENGGLRRQEVMEGEYWRLFTSMFIHGGLMHLLMNLTGLVLGVGLLKNMLNKSQLFLSYLACGMLASIASVVWHENTVSVGASGAIFGLYGMILAFTIFKIYPAQIRNTTWLVLGLYAGTSLLFGLFGGIDNAAHIGGLLSGFLLGVLLIPTKQQPVKNRTKRSNLFSDGH